MRITRVDVNPAVDGAGVPNFARIYHFRGTTNHHLLVCRPAGKLTAARLSEVTAAVWHEIDLDNAVWSIPAERMKSGQLHRVPLAQAAIAILQRAATLRSTSQFIFPGRSRGRPFSGAALTRFCHPASLCMAFGRHSGIGLRSKQISRARSANKASRTRSAMRLSSLIAARICSKSGGR